MIDGMFCRARSVSPLSGDSPACSLPQILEQPVIQVAIFKCCIILISISKYKRKVRGLMPCFGQNGYQAQVLQHPIDSYSL